jgi:hypothetical protein
MSTLGKRNEMPLPSEESVRRLVRLLRSIFLTWIFMKGYHRFLTEKNILFQRLDCVQRKDVEGDWRLEMKESSIAEYVMRVARALFQIIRQIRYIRSTV